jgi:hypothetical protein
MNATLLSLPIETPETLVSCANCTAVQRLERASVIQEKLNIPT